MKSGSKLKFTAKQREYYNILKNKAVTIAIGPSGVGKSLLALYFAYEMLDMGYRDTIYYSKPDTQQRNGLINRGTLPGSAEEKDEPLLAPALDNLGVFLIPSKVQDLLHRKRLSFVYLSDIRGRSLNHSTLIVDEAQNLPPEAVLAFMTRIGKNSSVIILGDDRQRDNPYTVVNNGLTDAAHRLVGLDSVGIVRFKLSDIVRSPYLAEIIARYDNYIPVREPNFSTNGHLKLCPDSTLM